MSASAACAPTWCPATAATSSTAAAFSQTSKADGKSDNNSDELRARGLAQQNTIKSSRDVNPWLAGPVVKDRLWFLGSFRRTSNSQVVAQAFYRDGTPGVNRISITQ